MRGSGRSKLDRELRPRAVADDDVVVVAATAWEVVGVYRAVEERMVAAAAPPRSVRWASIVIFACSVVGRGNDVRLSLIMLININVA